MEEKNKKGINRRNFLKTLGVGSVAATAAVYGCKRKGEASLVLMDSDVDTGTMTYRINPHTNDKVSLLGFGCMRFPLRTNDKGEEEVDQDTVNDMVDYAIEHGVNYFDTAPVYVRGWSETATGIALKRHPRDKFFIATKLSNHRGSPEARSFKGAVEMYHKSMKDLQVDYLDYYLLHNIGMGGMETFNERYIDNKVLDFLLKEREAGRIRNLGWSYHGDIKVFDYLLSMDIQWDFVQIQLNYVDWKHASGFNTNAEYLLAELEKRNVPAVIMEPLLGGRLARLNTRALKTLQTIHPEDTPAAWAMRYAGTPESVLTVLSGMVYMEHLQENIRTCSPLKPLNEQEYEALEKVTDIILNNNEIPCTECQYCMPCPYGIDIPGIFAHYNRIVNAGDILNVDADDKSQSIKDEEYRKARRAFLIGYDRSVPKLRQADHCIGCGKCNRLCPQDIDIQGKMRQIDEYAERLKRGGEA